MRRSLSHTVWLALLALGLAAPVAADADLSKIRKPGGYVIVLDKDGKAISGGYWLSPDLKVVVHSETSFPSVLTYVDREMFPRRIAQFELFMNATVAYDPEPTTLAVGKVAQIRQTEQFAGPLSKSEPKTLPIAVATTGLVSSKIQNIDLISRRYSVDGDWFNIPGRKSGQRVYVETLDIDLSATDAANVASIETGEASSSGDFHAIYNIRGLPLLPAVVKCLEEIRTKPEFQSLVKKQHETADLWMATTYVATGKSWWDREKVSPEEFEPNVSGLCLNP